MNTDNNKFFDLKDFNNIKQETKKYQLLARHIESLAINSNWKGIVALENNPMYTPYIKYMGGIGHSRALQFCVSKICDEQEAIKTIDYIVNQIKKGKKNISQETITGMLNIAIIYEKEAILDHILGKEEFKKKIIFSHHSYMIIKNMTNPTDKKEKRLLKKMIIDKTIFLDEKTRQLIIDSKDEKLQEIVLKLDLKEKIEKKLEMKEKTKNKHFKNIHKNNEKNVFINKETTKIKKI